MHQSDYGTFYDERRGKMYGESSANIRPEQHSAYNELRSFIESYNLRNKKCLEICSSYGFFQDMVEDYTEVDIAKGLEKYYHKPYFVAEGER